MRTLNKKANNYTSFILVIFFISIYVPYLNAQVEYEQTLSGREYNVGFIISWSTFYESDNQLFIIERSLDGVNFEAIGSVENKENDDINEYKYKDLDLGLKEVTYRLKELYKDGSSSYSDQIKLRKEFTSHFKIVRKEKLTDELFSVSVNTVKEGELECRMTNDQGDILSDEIRSLKIGLNDYLFDLTSEVDGKYTLIFKLGNELETLRLSKETKDKKGNVANKVEKSKGGG